MHYLSSHRRFRLGLILNVSPRWMGGIIYILNLIKILDFLEDEEKPEITLFYTFGLQKYADQIKYPYFKAVLWDFPSVYAGYLQSLFSGKNYFISKMLQQYELDIEETKTIIQNPEFIKRLYLIIEEKD